MFYHSNTEFAGNEPVPILSKATPTTTYKSLLLPPAYQASYKSSANMAGVDKDGAKFTLKLLVDASKKKVLFAEANKDFVDFMFSLLTLPVGSAIKLLSPHSMIGCIGRLYQSVEKLNESYLVANMDKEALLQPKLASSESVSPLLMLSNVAAESKSEVKYYKCSCNRRSLTTIYNTPCACGQGMTTKMELVVPSVSPTVSSEKEEGEGFVKGVVTYMVTDDLDVTPISAISAITFIQKYPTEKGGPVLEEKVVSFGMKKGIALLEASLGSKTALSDVFFGKSAACN